MIDRRNLLRGALFGAGMAAFPKNVMAAATKSLGLAAPNQGNGKLLYVFLRGGNDGLNTLVPDGDVTYPTARPTLAVPTAQSLPIPGVTFTRFSPYLKRLLGIEANGHLCAAHNVGDPEGKRSHFFAMDKFETAAQNGISQAALAALPGFVPGMLSAANVAPLGLGLLPAAVSVSPLMQRMFLSGNSDQVSAHVRSLEEISTPDAMVDLGLDSASLQHGVDHYIGSGNSLDKQLGYNIAFGGVTNSTLDLLNFDHAANFAATQLFPVTPDDIDAIQQQSPPHPDLGVLPYYDGKGAAFISALEQAEHALRTSPGTRVAGVEFGGWDTHSKQDDEHPNLLKYLGWGLRDVYDRIAANGLVNDITVVVVTEFGRTATENTGEGTDHGAGGLMLLLGGRVVPKIFNCHDGNPTAKEGGAAWRPLTAPGSTPLFDDACEVETEFRDVIAELAHCLLGVPIADLGQVVPGYPASNAGFPGYVT